MKQNCWGNDTNCWGNEAKCVGEMPQIQNEVSPFVLEAGNGAEQNRELVTC